MNKNYRPVSLGLRIKNYTFNKAAKIKLVSYNLQFAKETFETYPNKFFDWRETCEYIYPELEKFFNNNGLKTKYQKNE